MSVTAIALIIAGTVLVGAAMDRGTTNPYFKHQQHKEFNDPSKRDN